MAEADGRQYTDATRRNREPICQVLERVLPPTGAVLEIGSGTGEHAVYFAPRLKPRIWLPSDPDPDRRLSIAAWRNLEAPENLMEPITIDTTDHHWSVERLALSPRITAIVSINMIHISPWRSCLGLMDGAHRILQPGDILYLYGPFMRNGEHTAPSNAQFDDMLQAQNPEWGVRDLDDVTDVAAAQSLDLKEIVEMPANNLSVVFERR